MTSEARRLGRNATSAYANRGLMVLSVLLLTPYLFSQLGVAGFGAWSVMFTFVTVFSLFEIEFLSGVTTGVARLDGDRQPAQIGRLVRGGAVLMAITGVIGLVVAAVVAFAADGLAAQADRAAFRDGLIVLGAAMVLRLPCAAFGAALAGRQRFDLFKAAESVAIVGIAGGTVVALQNSLPLAADQKQIAQEIVAVGLGYGAPRYTATNVE
jgi:O-antigen/teichoic acid export membrane protein